jgi:hypothetical protein
MERIVAVIRDTVNTWGPAGHWIGAQRRLSGGDAQQ